MSLSDKIIGRGIAGETAFKELKGIFDEKFLREMGLGELDTFDKVLLVMDVKQFIKELKEGIHNFNETELGDKGRNDFIDKLAGEKLI